MADSSENQIIEQSEDACVPEIDNTNYFKEQDEKFEELHKKLQKLKEDNKKQIDAIINSIDDLMASKCVIEQTLDKVIPDDLPIEISNESLNVVDLLAKVTGIVNDSNDSLLKVSENEECESKNDSISQVSEEECKSQIPDKMDCTDDMPKNSESSKQTEKSPLVNSEDYALQDCKQNHQSQTSDKKDLTDNTSTNSKNIEDSPLVESEN